MAKWYGVGGEALNNKCGHAGCKRPAGRDGICGRHKKAYSMPGAPVNQAKKAQIEREKAEARRQKRGG